MNNHPPVAIIHRQSNFSCATNMCHQIISTRFLPATLEDSTDIPISEEEYTQLGIVFKDSGRTLWPSDLERLKQMNCPPPKYTRPRLAKGLRQDYMRLCRSEYMTIFRRPLSRINLSMVGLCNCNTLFSTQDHRCHAAIQLLVRESQ